MSERRGEPEFDGEAFEQRLRRARRAYEVGRVKAAARVTLYVGPVVTACLIACRGDVFAIVVVGVAAAVLAVAYLWRGEALERSVTAGFLGGALGFAVPPLFQAWGRACGGDPCSSFCAAAALCGGAVAVVVARARIGAAGEWPALAASLLATLVGLLGALLAGVAAALGFFAGALGSAVIAKLFFSPSRA